MSHRSSGYSTPPPKECKYGASCMNFDCICLHPPERRAKCRFGVGCLKLSDPIHMKSFLHPKEVIRPHALGGSDFQQHARGANAETRPNSVTRSKADRDASWRADRRATSSVPGSSTGMSPLNGDARPLVTRDDFEQALWATLRTQAGKVCFPIFQQMFKEMHKVPMREAAENCSLPPKMLGTLKEFPDMCTLTKSPSPKGPSHPQIDYVQLNPAYQPISTRPRVGTPVQTAGATESSVRQQSSRDALSGYFADRPQPLASNSFTDSVKDTVTCESSRLLTELARDLSEMWTEVNKGLGEIHGSSTGRAEENMLQSLINGSSKIQPVFPVYGAVKAGKSTFLSCVLREHILPAQALPMTSIPIKISHVGGAAKKLCLKQVKEWRNCLSGFRQKLIAGTLKHERARKDGDVYLFDIQEKIRKDEVVFQEESFFDADISLQLETLSHFVRLLWINDVNFEEEYGISLEVASLPEIEIDMRAFRDSPVKQFAFLDTPGPNEAKALSVLTKIGQQVMAGATGCIFCVPFDQVEASQTYQLYAHINRWMKGKRVLVIITKMDSFMGSSTEKESIEAALRNFFVDDMQTQLRVHFTSGFGLLALFQLEQLLHEYGHEARSFVSKLKSSKAWTDMKKLWHMDYIIDACGSPEAVVGTLSKFLGSKMKELNAKAVMDDFRQLYADSQHMALMGRHASLKNSFNRLEESMAKIQEYVCGSIQEQVRMQEKLTKVDDAFQHTLLELEGVPKSVREGIYSLLNTEAVEKLADWCASQLNWQVVLLSTDGEYRHAGEEVEFRGGKAEVLFWFQNEVKPKLTNAMKKHFKEMMDGDGGVIAQMNTCLQGKWTACKTMLARLEALGESNIECFLAFQLPPTVKLDIDVVATEVCFFDTDFITYTTLPDRVVIKNSVIKHDILKGFNHSATVAAEQITAQVSATCEIVLREFEELLSLEKSKAANIWQQNQALMEAKTSKKDVQDKLAEVESRLAPFKESLRKLDASMKSIV